MALPVLAPAINKTRQAITESSQRAILRLVPDLESGKPLTNKSFVVLGTIAVVGLLLSMFVITSLSTQDAFTLAKLQREAQSLSDQRDELNREIALASSPSNLAAAASKLGMKPNTDPHFISLSESTYGKR